MTGNGFPTTDAQFDEKIPRKCFARLDQVDSEIYGVCTSLFPPPIVIPFSLTSRITPAN